MEAFCDDVNIITNKVEDLRKVDLAVTEFEAMSGAVLSRNRKCAIMGFGKWKNKRDWPLSYVKCETEIKIFGIYVQDSYRSMVAKNWNFRFTKFQNCIKSWSSKILPSLGARVEVINTFALSRVFYVASILPINKTTVKKFEAAIGKFLWNASGYLLRVSMDEVKNRRDKGGLNLLCLSSMCTSLITSQFLRLLKSSDQKSVAHIAYWIGDSLGDLRPGIECGPHPINIPDYFAILESMVVFGKIEGVIAPGMWKKLTNKMIYNEKSKSFPVPKVEQEAGTSFHQVWKRINSPVLNSSSQDLSYLLVHNKLPVIERLFRVGLKSDPYCVSCLGLQIHDTEHFFCQCVKVVIC